MTKNINSQFQKQGPKTVSIWVFHTLSHLVHVFPTSSLRLPPFRLRPASWWHFTASREANNSERSASNSAFLDGQQMCAPNHLWFCQTSDYYNIDMDVVWFCDLWNIPNCDVLRFLVPSCCVVKLFKWGMFHSCNIRLSNVLIFHCHDHADLLGNNQPLYDNHSIRDHPWHFNLYMYLTVKPDNSSRMCFPNLEITFFWYFLEFQLSFRPAELWINLDEWGSGMTMLSHVLSCVLNT